ncbi:MAG: hypothetical protein ACI89L_002855, partial [Phycisphaerales bacterium]
MPVSPSDTSIKDKRPGLRRRIFVPFAIGLLVLQAVAVLTFYGWHHRHLESHGAQPSQDVAMRIVDHRESALRAMRSMAVSITQREDVRRAFLDRDLEKTQELLVPVFGVMSRDFGATRFNLHGPDGENFIRTHRPGHSGGLVDRWTFTTAARTGAVASGFEANKNGDLTLRCVVPWIEDDALLGYVELGMDFSRIATNLGEPLLVAVPKGRLDEQAYHTMTEHRGLADEWDQYPGVVVSYSTSPALQT